MIIEVDANMWDETLLGYGQAMLKKQALEEQMQAATTVDAEQEFYRQWEDQCELILTFKGKLAIMIKHLALHKAEAANKVETC